MSKSIITHTVHSIIVGQKKDDGYLNATALAKAHEAATGKRKDVRDWLLTDRANDYIERLSAYTSFPALDLVRVKKGGNAPGTWIHPKLAIPFATWLSVEFEFLVAEIVEAWLVKNSTKTEWHTDRIEGKVTRRTFTDAIRTYKERHLELSDSDKQWLYANASQQVDLAVFGRVAKKLASDLNSPREHLRDSFTSEELQLVREVENTAMRLIDNLDIHPIEAVKQAKERLLTPVQTRCLISGED